MAVIVFARKNDNTIESSVFNGNFWETWTSWGKPPVPGGATHNPACCTWGGKRLDLFTCGSDNQLWHKWIDDVGTQHEWESLGGRLSSGPAATSSMTRGRIDVFVRAPDASVWINTLTGGDIGPGMWSGWKSYGGKSISGPSACSSAPDYLEVFIFGEDHNIWHTSKGSEGWIMLDSPSSPTKLQSSSNPSAVVWLMSNVSVFAQAQDGSLWVRSWIFNPFSGNKALGEWKSWGGVATSGPAACHIVDSNRVDVFVRGQDKAIWHIYGNPQFDDKNTVKMDSLFGEWESDPSVVVTHGPWVIPPETETWYRASSKGIEIDNE